MRFRGVIALLMLFGAIGKCTAQADSILVIGKDTIRYKYTPASNIGIPATDSSTPTRASQRMKSGFLRKVFNYFEEAAIDKSFEKSMDATFIIAPYYTSSTSLTFAAMVAGLYRIDRSDRTLPPSTVNLIAHTSIKGFYKFGVDGTCIFKGNRHRLLYDVNFSSQPTYLWGFGYSGGMSDNPIKYISNNQTVNATYLYRLFKHTYIGTKVDFNWTYCSKKYRANLVERLGGLKSHDSATGLGIIAEYDTRDFIPNPSRGVYISLEGTFRPKALGSIDHDSWRASITVDYYQKLWRDAILAVDLYGVWNSRHTPWVLFAQMDGRYRMRGYYEGRFSDYNLVTAQVELRQRVWQRLGVVVWGGAGNVFSSFDCFRWSETMPNYGLGLRWEFKQRVNIRLDYGFGGKANGRLINGFLISINEAF
ncbi:MAG: BamA/TamA family outer membrane protein [Alistipes sp.]|nr:BamA/TamA family outer membrane protein [Alistipes sp.]